MYTFKLSAKHISYTLAVKQQMADSASRQSRIQQTLTLSMNLCQGCEEIANLAASGSFMA